MKKAVALLSLTALWTLPACGTDSTGEIAALQEKVAKVTQQLDETKKQVDGLQEANQRAVQAIENLTTTIERLNVAAPMAAPAGKGPMKAFVEQDLLPSSKQGGAPSAPRAVAAFAASPPVTSEEGTAPPQERAHPFLDASKKAHEPSPQQNVAGSHFSCGQVWKQIGQGKSTEAVAQALGSSIDAVHQCEEKIGRRVGKQ